MNRSDYQEYLASREWALKREAVRERSGDQCERCLTRPMDAVHHLTYERVGNERMEDLQAICDPCHEFLSGKTDVDPKTDGIKVYLAGPITGNRWRDQLFVGRIGCLEDDSSNFINSGEEWPIVRRALIGGFDFVGPWFEDTSSGHGGRIEDGVHGADPYGYGRHGDRMLARDEVATECMNAIRKTDVVFVWFPLTDSVPAGTLWEMGFAAGLGKPVVLAWDKFRDDYWFAWETATRVVPAEDARQGWVRFVKQWPRV